MYEDRDPRETTGDPPRPVVGTAAIEPLRHLLNSKNWTAEPGELAKECIDLQVKIYKDHKEESASHSQKVSSLFDQVARKVGYTIGEDPTADAEAIENLPDAVVRRGIWTWERLPYTALCAGRQRGLTAEEVRPQDSSEHALSADVDEWILRNERWLRSSKSTSKWKEGLIALSTDSSVVFPKAPVKNKSRVLNRPSKMPGYCILDNKRSSSVSIHSTVDGFRKSFDAMTGGVLKGLDWSNLFVAGGMVLGALLDVPEVTASLSQQWQSSDIDFYVYGLSPTKANLKLNHIFETFKSNLPLGAPCLVVRNSRTITLFSNFPIRRIQVILKLVESPKEVLLNFDLDICSLGYDGSEVWLLPRAARTLETGYNVFTMNLIQGHYLGERRATQENRVFKYASRGYGIRILPSYLKAIDDIKARRSKDYSRGDTLVQLNVEGLAEESRRWTEKLIEIGGQREWTHSILDSRDGNTPEPQGRSCMTGWTLFMRHVALFEAECAGKIRITRPEYAAQIYADGGVHYDDAPQYEWNESFDVANFVKQIESWTRQETDNLYRNMATAGYFAESYNIKDEERDEVLNTQFSRMVTGKSIEEILSPPHDINIAVWLPDDFIPYANAKIKEALDSHKLSAPDTLYECLVEYDMPPLYEGTISTDILRITGWRITALTMWQQFDRRIDEVFEMLWAFHRANDRLDTSEIDRVDSLKTQISKRAIRRTPEDEFEAFARWIGRKAVQPNNRYDDMWAEFNDSGMEDEDNEDEEDDQGEEDE